MSDIEMTLPDLFTPVKTGDYSLRAYQSVKQGLKGLGFISNTARDWSRTKMFTGGDWLGTFNVIAPLDVLEDWFYEKLGAHIEEYAYGDLTWEGFIWEMDLVTPDRTVRPVKRWKRRRRSYETLFNKVRCDYVDPGTDESGSTSWYEDTASQNRYGIKEEIIQRNLNETNAQEAAQEFLELYADGAPTIVAFEKPAKEPFLEITVAGYVATANFTFAASADDSSDDVDGWITDIFDELEFLTTGRVATNARSIQKSLSTPTRNWDLLEDLLGLRDGSGNRFNIVTKPGRTIDYVSWTNTPVGKLVDGAFETLQGTDLETIPRIMDPGIYRDSDYIGTAETRNVAATNSFFESPADFLLESIEVDKDGAIVPRLGVYDDEEAVRTFTLGEGNGTS